MYLYTVFLEGGTCKTHCSDTNLYRKNGCYFLLFITEVQLKLFSDNFTGLCKCRQTVVPWEIKSSNRRK